MSVVACAVALLAVVVVAWSGHLGLVGIMTAGLVILVAAGFSALRSFTGFFCAVMVIRPLLDLTAGSRSGGLHPTEVVGVAVLVLSVVWLAVNGRELVPRLSRPVPMAMLAYCIVLVFSTLGAPAPAASAPVVIRILSGVVIYLCVDLMLHLGTLSVRGLVWVLAASAAIPLAFPALGPFGVSTGNVKDGVEALKSVFFLSNNFAHFLVPVILVALAWAVMLTGWRRWGAALVMAVASVEMVATETRGAWLAVAFGALLLGILVSRRFLLGAVATVLVSVLFVSPVTDRLATLDTGAAKPRTESSLSWRFDQWATLFPETRQSPLMGIGPDESVRLTGKQAHNDYVRALVETGLLGLLAYLAIWVTIIRNGVLVLTRIGGTPLDWVTAAGRRRRRSGGFLVIDNAARATLVGVAVYVVAAALASSGENLIDNLTFLWVALPLAALLGFAVDAPAQRLNFDAAERERSEAPHDTDGVPVGD